jgi:hypothetical protein
MFKIFIGTTASPDVNGNPLSTIVLVGAFAVKVNLTPTVIFLPAFKNPPPGVTVATLDVTGFIVAKLSFNSLTKVLMGLVIYTKRKEIKWKESE